MVQLAHRFRHMLNYPSRVASVCMVFLVVTLLLNGTVWKLWGLHQDHKRMATDMKSLKTDLLTLTVDIKKVRDPNYIERQARDRLDLVGENELLFVFPAE
ncbi:MAG: septum formation initiator family protein [Bdellovibrionota bacterium]